MDDKIPLKGGSAMTTWSYDWFPLPGQAVFDRNVQQVAAVSRAPGNLDLFIVGFDNHVWSTFWNNQAGWSNDWFPLPSEAVFDRNVQQAAAVSRAPDNLDLFIVGFDNHSWSTYWGAAEVTMAKLIDNGPLGAKVTMVVVGDGFTAWDQDAYNRHVDTLLTNGLFTHDFYAANRSAFNLVRLNVLSNHSGVSTKTYHSDGSVTSTVEDTYFGAIFNGDWAHCWVEDGPNTAQRLNDLLNQWVPDRRLVFLLLNNPGFGGCGGGGRLTLPLGVSWSTVAHECGHALGNLADEYHQQNNAYSGGEPGQVNVTANTNRATLKWGWAVAASTPIPTGADDYTPPKPAGWDDNQGVGVFEGGSANSATGIYRPVINCRMKTNDPPFCPVCAAAMSAQTRPFLGPAPTEGTTMSTMSRSAASDSYVRLQVRLQDGTLSLLDAQQVDGPLVQPTTLPYGLVHEVLVDGRQVAVGAHPDANISRSFEEPGHGPGTHHTYELPTVDLTVRVPTAALRGADPSKVTISVYHVPEHPHTPLAPLAPLAHQPTLKVAPRANLTLDQINIPETLRTLMATK